MTSMYAVVDPAIGETLKEDSTITEDNLRDAIDRADRAQRAWSRSAAPVAERAAPVRRIGELHSERRKELVGIIVAEMDVNVVGADGADLPFGDANGQASAASSVATAPASSSTRS